jgi:hypothetical protein
MDHLIHFLFATLVILLAAYAFSWAANNPSSPLVGKI